ncbi:MAG: DUF1326 domain-containing protein [Geminicoccaceae bacterium]|nr:DUF1326 domain-containing protein [Geminicoccaceae bacterium]
MPHSDWSLEGPELGACDCAWGCPCRFNARPTRGDHRAAGAGRVDQGHPGEVRPDGSTWAPIREGGEEGQPVVDERADDRQRDALLTIIAGEETEPFATMFNVYASTTETRHDPLFLPSELEIDIAAQIGRISIPGLVEAEFASTANGAIEHDWTDAHAHLCMLDLTSTGPVRG